MSILTFLILLLSLLFLCMYLCPQYIVSGVFREVEEELKQRLLNIPVTGGG